MQDHVCQPGCHHHSGEQPEIQEEFKQGRREFMRDITAGGVLASVASLGISSSALGLRLARPRLAQAPAAQRITTCQPVIKPCTGAILANH